MPYIPNTDHDRRIMLQRIGVRNFEELLNSVPEKIRLTKPLELPEQLPELELLRELKKLAQKNRSGLAIFAGGGVYDHFIPAALENILSRPEFVTAYTPYQAEVAQGTLQVIYEFQSCICRLTGMDVANASMYDGASAAAEAVSLAEAAKGRNRIILSETVSPLFREVIQTYMSGRGVEITTVPHRGGVTDLEAMSKHLDDQTACVMMAQPNFFGLLEDLETGAEMAHKAGALMIAAIDPISAALLKTPADYGVDIVVGEGQSLGIPLNFGGPLLGFFAVKKELVRLLPGRLVGRTEDIDGKPGFVLTLQTREQHIRREKASSNICTNQALCATMALVYMTLLGKPGLKQVALLSLEKTHRAAERIFKLPGFSPYFKGDFIRETAVKLPVSAKTLIEKAIERRNVLPGINLGRFYSNLNDGLLLTITEKRSDAEIDALVDTLREMATE